MRLLLLFTLVIILLSPPRSYAQTDPGQDMIYRPTEVAIIRLTMAPEHKAYLQDPANAESEEYFPAVFEMVNSQLDTTLATEVGVRLRGNTSRFHDKKPFKIDFREYGGSKFFDYKKFNLKPNVNDPTLIRELLTLDLYRKMGVPAARTHLVRLYINDEYMGVYLNVEQIDDEFLDRRWGHEEGFLYKCAWGANLQDNGQVFNESIFESEINEDEDTRAELDHFVEVLNSTSSSNFVSVMEEEFAVDRYLRQLAVEAMLGHWDGYSYNQNNFYLFYDGQEQRVEFIPYDADNTWGIDWVDRDWATRDLNSWASSGQPRPLTTRILNVPQYRHQYILYLRELLENYFNEAYLWPIFDAYESLLTDFVAADTYFDNSFGFTHSDFSNAFDVGMDGNHVDYGLREFVTVRTQTGIEQIPALVTEVGPDVIEFQAYPNPSGNPSFRISRREGQMPSVMDIHGKPVSITATRDFDSVLEVELPQHLNAGMYIIRYSGRTVKWAYSGGH